MNTPPVGTEVFFEGMRGTVRFVCEKYVTICIEEFEEKVRDVCIVVYPSQFNQIQL